MGCRSSRNCHKSPILQKEFEEIESQEENDIDKISSGPDTEVVCLDEPQSSELAVNRDISDLLTEDNTIHLIFSFIGAECWDDLSVVSRRFYEQVIIESLLIDTPSSNTTVLQHTSACINEGITENTATVMGESDWLSVPDQYHRNRNSMSTLVNMHHSNPLTSSLYLSKMCSPNCVSISSCFTSLLHLTVGSIRYSHGSDIVCDRDMSCLVESLGHTLLSLRLFKLRGISAKSMRTISHHCTALRSLVIFGCDKMRQTASHNKDMSLFPCPTGSESLAISNSGADQFEGLRVLDVRYSLDLTNGILKQIMDRYHHIEIFLGSNLRDSGLAEDQHLPHDDRRDMDTSNTSTTTPLDWFAFITPRTPVPSPSRPPYSISLSAWSDFVQFYCLRHVPLRDTGNDAVVETEEATIVGGSGNKDVLFYVDDLQREHDHCTRQQQQQQETSDQRQEQLGMESLLYCSRYQYHPHDMNDRHSFSTGAERERVESRLGGAEDGYSECLPPDVDSFRLDYLLMSLPAPLDRAVLSMTRRAQVFSKESLL